MHVLYSDYLIMVFDFFLNNIGENKCFYLFHCINYILELITMNFACNHGYNHDCMQIIVINYT